MKIIYKIKAVITLLMSLYFLFFTDECKTFAGFFIYTLLMYATYIDEYLKEIKDGKETKSN